MTVVAGNFDSEADELEAIQQAVCDWVMDRVSAGFEARGVDFLAAANVEAGDRIGRIAGVLLSVAGTEHPEALDALETALRVVRARAEPPDPFTPELLIFRADLVRLLDLEQVGR